MNTNLDESFLRQLGIIAPNKLVTPVTILGVGAVGSASAMALGKMGVKYLTLIDHDSFEKHNVANQLCFEKEHVGVKKVEAVGDLVRKMAPQDLTLNLVPGKLENRSIFFKDNNYQIEDASPFFEGIVINCPDSMQARKDVWNICKYNPRVKHLIDVRMAGQFLQVFITETSGIPGTYESYEKTLYSDSEASEEPCGERGIIYTTLIIGGLVANFVKKLVLKESVPEEYQMDVFNGTTTQCYKGVVASSPTEVAAAMFK